GNSCAPCCFGVSKAIDHGTRALACKPRHRAATGPPDTALKASRKPCKLLMLARVSARPAIPLQQRSDDIRQEMSLTMAQGMKRLGTPVAALLGLVLVGLIASSWLIDRDALRQAVEAQIRAVTGLELVVNGPIDVSVFPGSYVSFHDVGLKGSAASDPALRVDVLTANLRLPPLLLRRFEIADLMMLRPQIRVVRASDGKSNWTPFIQTIARTMKPGADNQVSFSAIPIHAAILTYYDTSTHA